MSVYFTADLHFGHSSIIRTCNRPFENVDEMNSFLLDRYNERVRHDDDVYILGDVFMKMRNGDAQAIFNAMYGRKHLILGNHDKIAQNIKGWEWIKSYHEITFNHLKVVLFHYPMKNWAGMHHGSVQLYGHVHGRMTQFANQIDVGVDLWNYRPVKLDEILTKTSDLPIFTAEDYDESGRDRIRKMFKIRRHEYINSL